MRWLRDFIDIAVGVASSNFQDADHRDGSRSLINLNIFNVVTQAHSYVFEHAVS